MKLIKKLREIIGWDLVIGVRKGLSYKRVFKDGVIREYFLEHRRQMIYYNQYVLHNTDPDKVSNNYWNRI